MHEHAEVFTAGRWKRLEDERVAEEEQRKLRAQEAAAGNLGSAERAQKLSYLENIAQRNQIFNMNEAFQMLSKELSEMMQSLVSPHNSVLLVLKPLKPGLELCRMGCTAPLIVNLLERALVLHIGYITPKVYCCSTLQDLPWTLDAVQDDAYQWEVVFSKFAESSPLAQVLYFYSSTFLILTELK